ncbi:MAG: hypothetical protein KAU60_16190, partial [Desulfobacterales bacterium]|nr:hypothetical protein [Desulfobacterales bacterium]
MKFFWAALLLIVCFFPVNSFGGCIEGDCVNGQGTFIYANGDKYTGQFKDGKMHGKGALTSHDGAKYVGE